MEPDTVESAIVSCTALPWAALFNDHIVLEIEPISDDEIEERADAIEAMLVRAADADRVLCRENTLRLEDLKFKARVFDADQSPSPCDPYKYFSMSIVTHAHTRGAISEWDIANYRKWSRMSERSRRSSNISMAQMVHKIRIDIQIMNYFRTI